MARASSIVLLSLGLAAARPLPVLAQWIENGVPVCGSVCIAGAHRVIPDGAGGFYVAWRDSRDYPITEDDFYAQRLTEAGTVAAGWLPAGTPVCTLARNQTINSIASDGEGGLLLTWRDARDAAKGSNGDLYAQRLLPDGTIAPGWQTNGVPVALGPLQDDFALICSDGAGGAFIAWWRFLDPPPGELINPIKAYVQHLLADGSVAPGWPENGMPICGTPGDQLPMAILPDGDGGTVIVWDDGRAGDPDVYDTYALRLQADGSIATGWTVDGTPIFIGKATSRAVPDGAGGFYVAASVPWFFGQDLEYHVQRFTFAGTRATGWPEGGVLVCSAPDVRAGLEVAPDGLGGLLLTWWDLRLLSFEIFVSRLMPDGTRPPGWPENGVLVSDLLSESVEVTTRVAPDGSGGAYIAWERDPQVIMQHLDAQGAVAPGWPPGGAPVATTSGQYDPRPVSDGAGGAILVWEERNRSAGRLGLYAQRFQLDGPVAVNLSLASADAEPDRVTLVWHGAGAGGLAARVERRSESEDWTVLGVPRAEGADRLRYEDHSVIAGKRYAYRLAYVDVGIEHRTSETWIDVPSALEFSLQGFQPNPVAGTPVVAFTLPTAGPARLDVIDVTGRRVLTRDVGALDPGRHTLVLDAGDLAPGVYLIRLTHRERTLHTRGVIVR